MAHPEADPTAPPPRQDSKLWGHRLFTDINAPADWCTVGQAAEHQEANLEPDSILRQIADGKIESPAYTAAEASELLELLARKRS